MVAGGGELFRQTIDLASKLYVTELHEKVEGDVFFPHIDPNKWKETAREDHERFSFVEYKRV